MKNLKNKKYLWIYGLVCILLLIITLIAVTYSRYLSSAETKTNISVARWNIKVNGKSLSDFSTVINPVFPGDDNTAADIVAPNAVGYFKLTMDFSETDVSCDYTIDISSVDSTLKDLVVTGYAVGTDETDVDSSSVTSIEQTTSAEITGSYKYTDTAKTVTYKVFVKWNDDSATAVMNDIQDTELTKGENPTTSMNVNVSFKQVANT